MKIQSEDGIIFIYAHMDKIDTNTKVGGYVGSTGNSTGPHLHYEVQINGKPDDPKKYLPSICYP